jgi:hypothetical protein
MAGDSRGTVVIWVVAAALGLFALMRLTGSGGKGEAGEPVRVDASPGAATREAPAVRSAPVSTCTWRGRCSDPAS